MIEKFENLETEVVDMILSDMRAELLLTYIDEIKKDILQNGYVEIYANTTEIQNGEGVLVSTMPNPNNFLVSKIIGNDELIEDIKEGYGYDLEEIITEICYENGELHDRVSYAVREKTPLSILNDYLEY